MYELIAIAALVVLAVYGGYALRMVRIGQQELARNARHNTQALYSLASQPTPAGPPRPYDPADRYGPRRALEPPSGEQPTITPHRRGRRGDAETAQLTAVDTP